MHTLLTTLHHITLHTHTGECIVPTVVRHGNPGPRIVDTVQLVKKLKVGSVCCVYVCVYVCVCVLVSKFKVEERVCVCT
jgi:hypothetical protein